MEDKTRLINQIMDCLNGDDMSTLEFLRIYGALDRWDTDEIKTLLNAMVCVQLNSMKRARCGVAPGGLNG